MGNNEEQKASLGGIKVGFAEKMVKLLSITRGVITFIEPIPIVRMVYDNNKPHVLTLDTFHATGIISMGNGFVIKTNEEDNTDIAYKAMGTWQIESISAECIQHILSVMIENVIKERLISEDTLNECVRDFVFTQLGFFE